MDRSVESEHGAHDPRDDNDGCPICRAHRSSDPNDAKIVEDWWRTYDRRAANVMDRSDLRRAVTEGWETFWKEQGGLNPAPPHLSGMVLQEHIIRRLEWYWDGQITRTVETRREKD